VYKVEDLNALKKKNELGRSLKRKDRVTSRYNRRINNITLELETLRNRIEELKIQLMSDLSKFLNDLKEKEPDYRQKGSLKFDLESIQKNLSVDRERIEKHGRLYRKKEEELKIKLKEDCSPIVDEMNKLRLIRDKISKKRDQFLKGLKVITTSDEEEVRRKVHYQKQEAECFSSVAGKLLGEKTSSKVYINLDLNESLFLNDELLETYMVYIIEKRISSNLDIMKKKNLETMSKEQREQEIVKDELVERKRLVEEYDRREEEKLKILEEDRKKKT